MKKLPLFEIDKNELEALSDTDLRELVGRLCEAELAAAGLPTSGVLWSGAQTVPDGGLDVEIKTESYPVDYAGNFMPRSWTGIQVKKHSMGKAAIQKEMLPKGQIRPIISEIAYARGAFIIVSLADDCAAGAMRNRRSAMANVLSDAAPDADIVIDFYDRGRLITWLRAHPSVQLWVRERLGKPQYGWRPFGRWSAISHDTDDTLICEPSLKVVFHGMHREPVDIVGGINAVRQLVRSSEKAVRIIGLSGAGKSGSSRHCFNQMLVRRLSQRFRRSLQTWAKTQRRRLCETPALRQTSSTPKPASTYFKINAICYSVNRDVFIVFFPISNHR